MCVFVAFAHLSLFPFSVYRKQETLQIQEAEAFSSKRCLEWFYEYAGTGPSL